MGEIVNLKRVRKQRERDAAGKQAEVNRAQFGRSRTERERAAAEAKRVKDVLDGAKTSKEELLF